MIITRTPLRVSFAGGGTDFRDFYKDYGGQVVSTAINKYIYVIVKKRFDDRIYVGYMHKEIVSAVNDIQHDLVRETMKLAGISSGVEIVILADIPSSGSGLGSSSSLTVGLLNALYNYRGKAVEPEKLAREACQVEIDILGKPIGIQDQYIAAYGGFKHIYFAPDDAVQVHELNLDAAARDRLAKKLLLIYTGKTRKAEGILAKQRQKIHMSISVLLAMKEQAAELKQALEGGDFDYLGQMLGRAWENKKKLADNISNNEVDKLYKTGIRSGATGGKLCGAGGGGFLLFYCPPEKQPDLRKTLNGYIELTFDFESKGTEVIFTE
jgi:D-glycero-alpha-D-manno-heptose-7-phosphate kinase